MTVNWTKMIYNEEESKSMLFVVLISSIIIGILSCFSLMFLTDQGRGICKELKNRSLYEYVKLTAVLIFGFCNVTHCIFFYMKHDSGSSGCFDRYAGKVYNILSIVYTVLLSVVIFTKVCRGFKEVLLQKYLFVGILFSNFSFLLDTIFSERRAFRLWR